VAAHADRRVFDVRIREWTLPVRDVQPHFLFKPCASLAAV
jgi:hypothetical protein